MRRSQLVGLLLWRAGLLLVGSYGTLRIARLAWEHLDLPPQIEWGLTFLVAGVVLVVGSIAAERFVDRSEEGMIEA